MKRTAYFLLILMIIFASSIVLATDGQSPSTITNITSENYIVSKENQLINRILPQTLVEDFKEDFNVDSSNVHVYDSTGKQEITEGYIGTGMKIKFDNHESIYVASVIGDLTGKGTIKQIDVTNTIRHVIGLEKYQLTGEKALSADVDGDGEISQKDVSILIKYVVFGELDIGELRRPTAPTFQVLSGTGGENGWYTSDVILTVKKPTSSPIPVVKMTYSIAGSMTKEETVIEEGEEIRLTEAGTYELRCYSITAAGVKSAVRKKVIKIDKEVQDFGTIVMKLNDENGDIYQEDTWTNQNVYVEVQNGGEEITTTYKVEGANEVEETSSPTVLTKEGISTITLINKDQYGNTTKREIIVKIDRVALQKPTIKITGEKILDDSIWYTEDVTVNITGTKENSGAEVGYIQYQLTNTKTGTKTEGKLNNGEALTITDDGVYELVAYVIDEAGNKSEAETAEIYLDKTNPTSGTMELHINNENGNVFLDNSWTNQNVYAKLVAGTDQMSGHSSTIYKLSGKTGDLTEPVVISTEGTYTITVITTDVSGRTAQRVYHINIDKQKPEAPSVSVKEGTKEDNQNEWYNSDVTLEVIQGTVDKGGSGIGRTVYEISGQETVAEQEIEDRGTISIKQDGIYNITAYNYDVAGNKSEGTTITIKTDKTAPQNIQILPSNITGTSYHLQVSSEEPASGIALYQFYVDGELYKEIETNDTTVECDIINQSSQTHNVLVKIKDLAGNIGSASLQIQMENLSISDIDHVEFVVNSFTQTKDGAEVNSGAEFIVSDTSISNISKYIQVSSVDTGTTGIVTGNLRVVRKDGEVVDLFQYYPENLCIEIAQYSSGSGSTWTHQANINMANTTLSNTDGTEDTMLNASINISQKQNSDNIFSVSDRKSTGTKTYTRLIVKEVNINGEKVPFTIISNII